MSDYYHQNFNVYHEKTFFLDMSSVLIPFAQRLSPGSSVLDVGCGSGRDLLWLKKRGFRVIGFERSPGLAKLAREHAECKVIEGDFEAYDFSELPTDAILLMGSLVHVPHERFDAVFGNIMRGLKPRGYVMVSLKQGRGEKEDAQGRRFYLWEDADLRKRFKDAGFGVADFLRQASAVGTGEIWLAYVLGKLA